MVFKALTNDTYLGVYEVIQSEWEPTMAANPSFHRGKDFPVEEISYNDAVKYAELLSRRERVHYRLPTRAEWLQAYGGDENCRGSEEHIGTISVLKTSANKNGYYGMLENVQEWCSDLVRSPYVPQLLRAVMGNSFAQGLYDSPRFHTRYGDNYKANFVGIRLIVEPKQNEGG
jgi:formylglycine-generating enzyme required for sulfatase activity